MIFIVATEFHQHHTGRGRKSGTVCDLGICSQIGSHHAVSVIDGQCTGIEILIPFKIDFQRGAVSRSEQEGVGRCRTIPFGAAVVIEADMVVVPHLYGTVMHQQGICNRILEFDFVIHYSGRRTILIVVSQHIIGSGLCDLLRHVSVGCGNHLCKGGIGIPYYIRIADRGGGRQCGILPIAYADRINTDSRS